MSRRETIGAVDIGGTKIAVALVHDGGSVIAQAACPTLPEAGPDLAILRIIGMLRELQDETGLGIKGIGIGCTGPVDPASGSIGQVDLLPGWTGARPVDRLAGEFNCPAAMENDADAAALAESRWGAGAQCRRFIYVSIGTGIGAGVVLDGNLYRGVDGSHPEIGHHTLDPAGPECYCGALGCWEAVASGPALASRMNALQPMESLNAAPYTARDVFRLAGEGNENAKACVDKHAYYLGLGLANLVGIFCPDRIALGGGVMTHANLLLEPAMRVIRQQCRLVPADRTEIVLAGLRHNAALLGAAQVWLHRFTDRHKEMAC